MDSKSKQKAARPGAQVPSKPAVGDRCLACLPCACFQFLALYIQRNTDSLVKCDTDTATRHEPTGPLCCSSISSYWPLTRTLSSPPLAGARGRRST